MVGFCSGCAGSTPREVLLPLRIANVPILRFSESAREQTGGAGPGGHVPVPKSLEVDVSRRSLLSGLAGVVVLLAAAPAASAQSSGGCQLQGTANITPGLNNNAQNFTYNFGGNLTGCQSSQSGAPATGTVSAGQVLTIGGLQYQEPVPTGNGSCGNSTTKGTAIVNWADG